MRNRADIFEEKHKNRLENAFALNKPLASTYYLREDLKEIRNQLDKASAGQVMDLWIQ